MAVAGNVLSLDQQSHMIDTNTPISSIIAVIVYM